MSSVITENSLSRLSELGFSSPEPKDGYISLLCRSYSSSIEDDTASLDVPQYLDSEQSLRFIGLSKRASVIAYEQFCASEDPAAEIVEFAKGHVMRGNDAWGEHDDEWFKAMRMMGVSKVLRARIMTPGFESLRRSKTAREWTLLTMQQRYEFLLTLEDKLHKTSFVPLEERLRITQAAPSSKKSTPSSKQVASASKQAASSSKQATLSSKQSTPNAIVKNATADQTIAVGETLLMKAGAITRLEKAFRSEGIPGSFYMIQRLFSTPPTDFSKSPATYYFTKQQELANEFAMFARARLGEAEVHVGVLYLVVPNELLAEADMLHGEEWNQYVWHNRLEAETPEHLGQYDRSKILIGPMVRKSNPQISRLHQEGNDWTCLEAYRLRSSEAATQHVFKGEEFIQRVNQNCRAWLVEWPLQSNMVVAKKAAS
ncbi:hypothetical protein P7C71_g1170, partial [Lecanoromycetidae sp. Uapishka_2]